MRSSLNALSVLRIFPAPQAPLKLRTGVGVADYKKLLALINLLNAHPHMDLRHVSSPPDLSTSHGLIMT